MKKIILTQPIFIIIVITTFLSCKKAKTAPKDETHHCSLYTYTIISNLIFDTILPGQFMSSNTDTLYAASINTYKSPTLSYWEYEYCNCDSLELNMTNSDSLVYYTLQKDGILIDSTNSFGDRRFLITETGDYEFCSIYYNPDSPEPIISADTTCTMFPFNFTECDETEQ